MFNRPLPSLSRARQIGNSIDLATAAIVSLVWLLLGSVHCVAETVDRPNILVFLVDDMGYGDAGCLGSQTLQTPNIDALASSGVLCQHAYVASSVCAPSRAGLMTGRDPRRFGFQANLNNAASHYSTRPDLLGLPPNERTIADHLRNVGYATALIGKWHLGTGEAFHPNVRGFDYFCGMLEGSHHYFPETIDHSIQRNGEAVTEFSSEYLTDFFTDECVAFMQRKSSSETGQPWFVLASYNAPHTPMHAKEEDLARFDYIKNPKRRTYAAMMFALDRGIGRIRQHLESTGQWDNTLCVFFSDNGGPPDNRSWNGALRGVKGCLREGGIRVPMIWTWPNNFPRGQRCASVVSSLDLLPTFMAAAGSDMLPLGEPMSHQHEKNRRRMMKLAGAYDGINLLPLLTQPNQSISRRLYWRLQGQAAILDGADKLVRLTHRPAELFRPADDPGESNELSATETARSKDLLALLGQWEFALPTVQAWGSSPWWNGVSAQGYDEFLPQPEPESDSPAMQPAESLLR